MRDITCFSANTLAQFENNYDNMLQFNELMLNASRGVYANYSKEETDTMIRNQADKVLGINWATATPMLVGKRFGKHKITWKLADGKKSIEGSLAMFICAFLSVLIVLLVRGGVSISLCLGTAIVAATVCTVAEMCTKNGLDTVICPVSAMVVIIPMVTLLGG